MTAVKHPTSLAAACVWVPLFPLKCETERQPALATLPVALLSPDDSRRVWQVSPQARRAGVKARMTVSQAIGACPALRLCEADPVHYDERFSHLLAALGEVSPVIEPAELGRAFVGMDGLEGLYGGPAEQVGMLLNAANCGIRNAESKHEHPIRNPQCRVGWGLGKFTAALAAMRALPGEAVVVPRGEEAKFLATQPVTTLPLEPELHRRLRLLGLRTLGEFAALPEAAVTAQFGRAGTRAWRLATGRAVEPVVGRSSPEPVTAALAFFSPVAEHDRLARAAAQLVERALRHPRRIGWRVQVARLVAGLERGGSWVAQATFKDPSADRDRIVRPLALRLEQTPPAGAVTRLSVEFLAFSPGTAELQLFARDASAAARAGRRRALRTAAREIALRLKRPMLSRVVEVNPWSRLPERRYALIDYEP